MYTISVIHSGFHRFYNFQTGKIDQQAYKESRTSDHYTGSKEEAKKAYENLVATEQRKAWGYAKTVYTYYQDELVNF